MSGSSCYCICCYAYSNRKYKERGIETGTDNRKICVIGAGASGLMAAITAASGGALVTVLEHKDRAAVKLLLTGNGKCNLTNEYMKPECYYQPEDSRLFDYIKRFDNNSTLRYFESIGVHTVSKDGYIYPDTFRSEDVANALIEEALRNNVHFRYNEDGIDINRIREEYDAVIIATGGRSYPKTGSNGSGYKFLEKLGVKYNRVLPALCPVYSNDEFCKRHSGERVLAEVKVIDGYAGNNDELAYSCGEIQLTKTGLSGIAIFQISRFVSKALDEKRHVSLDVNFNPKPDKIPSILRGHKVCKEYGRRIFEINHTESFAKAQVCTGGVSLNLLDDNLQLIDVPGVYLCGEIIDVDGICGGYNLQWAWTSGYIAGGGACLG